MSDTPETDGFLRRDCYSFTSEDRYVKLADVAELARRLERERDAAITERDKAKLAIRPFAMLGGPDDGFAAAYHDLEDDVVVYENSGKCITAGDVRAARRLVSNYVQHAPSALHERSELARGVSLALDHVESQRAAWSKTEVPPEVLLHMLANNLKHLRSMCMDGDFDDYGIERK